LHAFEGDMILNKSNRHTCNNRSDSPESFYRTCRRQKFHPLYIMRIRKT